MLNELMQPPQAIEAEESLLSQCLVGSAEEVVDALSIDDFYKTAHKKIFETISYLQKKGDPVELVTIMNRLKETCEIDSVGGASSLVRLIDVPIPSSVGHYIKIIKDKDLLRNLISTASEISADCYANKDAEEIIDSAQKKIIGIDYTTQAEITPVGDVLVEVIEELEQRQHNDITGIPTGISRLDMLLGGMQPTDSIILGGRPSMGKTSLALNIIRYASIERGIPSAIFSLEMSKKQLTKRWISMIAKIDGGRFLTNAFSKSDWEKITSAASQIDNAPIYIDDRAGLSYGEVRRSLRRMVKRYGVKFAVIDYMQLMTGDRENGRTGEVGSISRAIKGMAKKFEIPILALCQLNRKLEERSDKRPMLSDLRDSGEIEQDADVVLFVYRDEVYNKDPKNPNRGTAEILVSKHREGAIGKVNMAFLKAYQRFEQLQTTY